MSTKVNKSINMGIISEVLYLIVFVICPIFISLIVIKNTKRCNILIQGTYAGYSPYVYKNITLCYPIFKYNYKGKKYCNQASLSIPDYNLQKYIKGNTYHIYINDNNPDEYILEKGNPTGAYICIAIGIVFMFLFFLVKIGVLT